jgi:integrase
MVEDCKSGGATTGKNHVGSLRPKHVIQLRDAWAETPVAANHLLSVLKTLINWGIPREFSDANPCVSVPKLKVDEKGARPWPMWAYSLIEEHGSEEMRRAVLLARYTGQRQADVLRMGPSDIEDGGINVVQQKTGKELWVPLHASLRDALEGWNCSPFVLTPKGEGYTPRPLQKRLDAPDERHACRTHQEGGLHLPRLEGVECGEVARGRLR